MHANRDGFSSNQSTNPTSSHFKYQINNIILSTAANIQPRNSLLQRNIAISLHYTKTLLTSRSQSVNVVEQLRLGNSWVSHQAYIDAACNKNIQDKNVVTSALCTNHNQFYTHLTAPHTTLLLLHHYYHFK